MRKRAAGRGLILLIVVMVLIAGVMGVGAFTSFFGNVWFLATGEGYVIPARSSIFTFQAMVMNDGSGDWWLYGEDGRNFYRYTGESPYPYVTYSKTRAGSCPGFDPHDGKTWCP
jgi:hypothetical protein